RNLLRRRGLWTIPGHTWDGAGLPDYIGMHAVDEYPQFEYLDRHGKDHREHAFGMLTPVRTTDGLPVNVMPDPRSVTIHQPGVDYLASIAPSLIARFPFDFVRMDFTDHVLDSVLDDGTPISDRPTPHLVRAIAARLRRDHPSTGFMAERMGWDIEAHVELGF